MSFIIEPPSQNPLDYPATVQALTQPPYYKNINYQWNITNFDSYTAYTASIIGGVGGYVSLATPSSIIDYQATNAGVGGFRINNRNIPITILDFPYWLARVGTNPGVSISPTSIDVDGASNDIFVVGSSGFPPFFNICKLSPTPSLQTQVTLFGGGAVDSATGVAHVTGSIVYVVGNSNNDIVLAQYDQSLNLLWQRTLGGVATHRAYAVAAVNATQDVYVVGSSNQSGTNDFYIAKFNAAGSLLWQRVVTGVNVEISRGVGVNIVTGDVFVCGTGQPSGYDEIISFSFSAAGVLQWSRSLGYGALLPCQANGLACDNAGTLYVVGTRNNDTMVIARYSNLGALVWQRLISAPGFVVKGAAAAVHPSSNYCYFVGQSDVYGVLDTVMLKFDANTQALQWQRSLRNSTNNTEAKSITLSGGVGADVYVASLTNSPTSPDILISKLPSDGTRTGTFVLSGLTFTYAASALTDAAGTGTNAALALAATPGVAINTTGTLLLGTSNLGAATVAVP